MKYRHIQGTNLTVSEVGIAVCSLVSQEIEGNHHTDPHHLLRYSVDRGINFFETADIYGQGRAEELMGNALFEERDRIVIATRFGYGSPSRSEQGDWNQSNRPSLTPKYVKRACEASLKRLRTDRIDLYQVHHPDITTVEQDDLFASLEKLKKSGKILSWGVVMHPEKECVAEAKLCVNLRKPSSLQTSFHLLDVFSAKELVEHARQSETRVILEMPTRDEVFKKAKKIEELDFINQSNERTFWQTVLKFSLLDLVTSSVIVDITTEDELNEAVITSECPDLTVEEIYCIRRWLERTSSKQTEPKEHLFNFFPGDLKASGM